MFAEEIATVKRLGFRYVLLQGLTLASILSSALMFWKGLGLVFNTESPVVVVMSESMEPGIHRGDLLVLYMPRSAPIEIGDITVYKIPGNPTPIVHRVLELHEGFYSKDQLIMTKGDNNPTDDASLYAGRKYIQREFLVGKVIGYVPYVGYLSLLINDSEKIKCIFIALIIGSALITG